MTLTHNPNLAKVKVNSHVENQGPRPNGSSVRPHTDGQTHGQMDRQTDEHYQMYYLLCFAVDSKSFKDAPPPKKKRKKKAAIMFKS